MDHIFGESHDIAFGSKKPKKALQKPSISLVDDFSDLENEREQTHKPRNFFDAPVRVQPQKNTERNFLSKKGTSAISRPKQRTQKSTSTDAYTPPQPILETSALERLIVSMKPSFLPPSTPPVARIVPFSDAEVRDGFYLVEYDKTTILVGSGFGEISNAGVTHRTFPDMRLPFQERNNIAAWILLDDEVDVTLFQLLFPALGFPPVYATRDIIANFRNNIKDEAFLGKCRFFELFPSGMNERKIGDITLLGTTYELKTCLTFRFHQLLFCDTSRSIGVTPTDNPFTKFSLLSSSRGYNMISPNTDISIASGEILQLQSKGVEKNTLKFTFDTFYEDKSSIGVVASYTLKDREELSENGILTFVLEEDHKIRAIMGHIYIDSRGFVHPHEMMVTHKEIIKGIRATYEKTILANPRTERADLVHTLRREITKYCYLLTGRTPMVLPIVLEH